MFCCIKNIWNLQKPQQKKSFLILHTATHPSSNIYYIHYKTNYKYNKKIFHINNSSQRVKAHSIVCHLSIHLKFNENIDTTQLQNKH